MVYPTTINKPNYSGVLCMPFKVMIQIRLLVIVKICCKDKEWAAINPIWQMGKHIYRI